MDPSGIADSEDGWKFGGYMKKLLFLILLISAAINGMQPTSAMPKITYTKAQYSQQHRSLFIQAIKDKSTIGEITFIQSALHPKNGHIISMEVNEECRGEGVGYKLFRQAILELQKIGCSKCCLDSIGTFRNNYD